MNDNKCYLFQEFSKRSDWGRILELGPYDGRDTVPLARHCRELVVIEGRPENIKATMDYVNYSGLSNVQMVQGNLETFGLESIGRVDLAWASGILYHLAEPWELVQRIAGVTGLCYGWTHLAEDGRDVMLGYRGRVWAEPNPAADRLGGMSSVSFWLAPDEFRRVWSEAGMACRFLHEPTLHPNGGLDVQFIAERAS